MGMFDTFVCKCPHCDSEFHGQTKLYACLLEEYSIGDFVKNGPIDTRLELKEFCEKCDGKIVVVIDENGMVIGFEKDDAHIIEKLGGEIEVI
jgi:hypothetical protein